jgi:hypothetical protein
MPNYAPPSYDNDGKTSQRTSIAPKQEETADKKPFFQPNADKKDSDTSGSLSDAHDKEESAVSTRVEAPKEDELSPIRKEIFKLFEVLNEKGTHAASDAAKGSEDKEWKDITGQSQADWNTQKKVEAPWEAWRTYKDQKKVYEAYLKAMEYYKSGAIKKEPKKVEEPKVVERPKGDEIHKETTCILTASSILKNAAKKLNMKYDSLQLMNPKALAISPAWTWASPGMTARPKPGDIFIFVALGDKISSAQLAKSRAEAVSPKDVERLLKAKEAAQKVLDDGLAKNQEQLNIIEASKLTMLAEVLKPDKLSVLRANLLVKAWKGAIKIWEKNLREANERYDKAINGVRMAEQRLEEARAADSHKDYYFFSHVGIFESMTMAPDGKKELWKTFDGGRTFVADDPANKGKQVTKQGAKHTDRVYDPSINETWMNAGSADRPTQDGLRRWVLGWYDTDKLVH